MDVEGAVGQPDGGSEGDGDGEGAAAQQPGGVSGRSGGGGLHARAGGGYIVGPLVPVCAPNWY